jgi:flavin reductase (DIM6/NTAB) family NADH-FMN oxidoreductase RutF
MAKVKLGKQTILYPMPVLLIGSNVNDKPNIMTAAWGSIACMKPPMACIALNQIRYTLKGIKQNNTFSINVPSTDSVLETDYCGITPGSKVDKVEVCNFGIFYGALKTAPMIEQCPLNLECSVFQILNLGSHDLIIGKIEEVYINEDCLTDGKPDGSKIKPFNYLTGNNQSYHEVGKFIAKSFSAGKKLRK